jgi:hypothetical protein
MRTLIKCSSLVVLIVLTGCGTTDDNRSCIVPDNLIGMSHGSAHDELRLANLRARCHGWESGNPVSWVTPPGGSVLTCGDIVDLYYNMELKIQPVPAPAPIPAPPPIQ